MVDQQRFIEKKGHKRLRLIARLHPEKMQRTEPLKVDIPSLTNASVSKFPTPISSINATTTTIEKTDTTCENKFARPDTPAFYSVKLTRLSKGPMSIA